MQKQFLEVGKVMATFGIKGALKVEPWMNSPEELAQLKNLYINDGKEKLTIESASVYKGIVRIHFEGIDSIDEAAPLRQKILFMDRDDYPLEEGSYFLEDLLHLSVIDADTQVLYGEISEIVETTGANRVYAIKTPQGKEVLIPVIPDVVIDTDLEAGVMKIRPLAGLFDGEEITVEKE